jgi:hypothetical protein
MTNTDNKQILYNISNFLLLNATEGIDGKTYVYSKDKIDALLSKIEKELKAYD